MDRNSAHTIVSTRNLDLYYGTFQALKQISLDITEQRITALIDPFRLWQVHLFKDDQPHE